MPNLTVVVLTWNEEENVADCLRTLARQSDTDIEVVLIDAASTDGTVAAIRAVEPSLPFPLQLVVADRRIPIGEARNRGLALARTPYVAFLSADAGVTEVWVEEAKRSLARYDLVYGRQLHTPERWTIAAQVRGLRYHFPPGFTGDPLRFASNVAAAYRREVLEESPFDDWAKAAEDLLIARRAQAAGRRVLYNPRMVVLHRDVRQLRQEWRKNVNEGYGCGLYVHELGVQWPVLAWGLLLVAALATFALGTLAGVLATAAVVWLPAARRGFLGHHSLSRSRTALAVAASPPFDLAFLTNYLRGLALHRRAAPAPTPASSPSSAKPSSHARETQEPHA